VPLAPDPSPALPGAPAAEAELPVPAEALVVPEPAVPLSPADAAPVDEVLALVPAVPAPAAVEVLDEASVLTVAVDVDVPVCVLSALAAPLVAGFTFFPAFLAVVDTSVETFLTALPVITLSGAATVELDEDVVAP
jgi:hypothetical protein